MAEGYCIEDLNKNFYYYLGAFGVVFVVTASILAWLLIKFKDQLVYTKKKKAGQEVTPGEPLQTIDDPILSS